MPKLAKNMYTTAKGERMKKIVKSITIDKMSDKRVWETYKSQVGYLVRFMLCN